MNEQTLPTRQRLLEEIEQLARHAIYGTLSESYRTCGNPRCRCHAQGPKHGPHLYISYRGERGKTTGYYVPKAAESEVRRAWRPGANSKHCCGSFPRSTKSAPSKPFASKNRRTFATGFRLVTWMSFSRCCDPALVYL